MKNVFLFLLLILLSTLSYSQITITATDVQNYFTPGSTYTDILDTTATSVDIGSTGNFTLDLTGLTWNVSNLSSAITPSESGFAGEFPTATYAVHSQITDPDSTDAYSFYNLGTDLQSLGVAGVSSVEGLTVTILDKFLPYSLSTKLPLTLGTTWTDDYTDSSYITYEGLPPFGNSSHVTSEMTVDGWGTLLLPGKTLQVLRIKDDTRFTNQILYTRSISYQYISQSGESVSISLADTNAPGSGVVDVDGISWHSLGTTGIREELAGVTDYRLLNNYPNPFNPSTKIAYYVPVESKVEISVYNVMGEKVRNVYNGVNIQGLQEINFDASGLASGTYFYKMNAASTDGKQNFTSTGKMLLLK